MRANLTNKGNKKNYLKKKILSVSVHSVIEKTYYTLISLYISIFANFMLHKSLYCSNIFSHTACRKYNCFEKKKK